MVRSAACRPSRSGALLFDRLRRALVVSEVAEGQPILIIVD